MRVGQYDDAVRVNALAVKADRGYIRRCQALGFYPGVYYPHNIHFLWWAQLFDGRSKDALRTANEAALYAVENYCGPKKAFESPRLRHLPWLTLLRFGRYDEVLVIAQPPNTNDFIVDRALWHYCRGLAFAALKNGAGAQRESDALAKIAKSDEVKKISSPVFPAADTLGVASLWLAGRTAGANGDNKAMIESLEKAVAAEDAMPYMEPSFWPIPVRPALGAALIETGDATRAETIFRENLKRWPRNAWGLLGLEESLRTQGKTQQADDVKRQRIQAWSRADTRLELAWF